MIREFKTVMLWAMFALAVVGLGFSFWPAGAQAESGLVTFTTNDPDSFRAFLLSNKAEEWLPGRRAVEFYTTDCKEKFGSKSGYLGTFNWPPPIPPNNVINVCLVPHPLAPMVQNSWCQLAGVGQDRELVVVAVKNDGFTVVCGPPGKES
jgi:hypothetical protein